jgi:DNA-binding NarL/FixJ family response regulator
LVVFVFAPHLFWRHADAVMSIRVAIVEDETMVADMLQAWLSRRPQLQVVGCAATGAEALTLCRKQNPDVATVDIQLPGLNGLDLSEQLLRTHPALKILILTCRSNPYCLIRARELGVHGYVDKMSPLPELEKAILAVSAGQLFFSDNVQHELNREQRRPDAFNKILTEREREILGLISLGLSDADVAAQLDISPETVGTHRRNASHKLDIFNDRKLMRYGREVGLDMRVHTHPPASGGHRAHRKSAG